jgi:hypothetical protein
VRMKNSAFFTNCKSIWSRKQMLNWGSALWH